MMMTRRAQAKSLSPASQRWADHALALQTLSEPLSNTDIALMINLPSSKLPVQVSDAVSEDFDEQALVALLSLLSRQHFLRSAAQRRHHCRCAVRPSATASAQNTPVVHVS
eukprot:1525042-Rhodomonas_salina.1